MGGSEGQVEGAGQVSGLDQRTRFWFPHCCFWVSLCPVRLHPCWLQRARERTLDERLRGGSPGAMPGAGGGERSPQGQDTSG